jgi:serine/threonine protein kinase
MAFDRWTDGGLETDLDDVLLPGTLLCKGKYHIQSFLSAGGFGITYLARDSQGRDLILKECFVPDFCRRSQGRVVPRSEAHKSNLKRAVASFLDEAQTISTLSHANIVRAHEAFEENDTAYVVLDFIKGHDLQEIIDDKKTSLSPAQLVGMAQRLISALSHVHGRGLLHCDVSPDNFCVASNGEPILIDFGSARRHIDGVGQPHAGFSMVKDGYSPPEFYTPNAACGPYSDVYSLGATLYHAVTGVVPIDGQTRLTAMIDGKPDPLMPVRGRITGYPSAFLASIDRAMSVRAGVRFASAKDWLRALAQPAPEAPPKALDVLVLREVLRPANPAPRLHLGG